MCQWYLIHNWALVSISAGTAVLGAFLEEVTSWAVDRCRKQDGSAVQQGVLNIYGTAVCCQGNQPVEETVAARRSRHLVEFWRTTAGEYERSCCSAGDETGSTTGVCDSEVSDK